MASRMTRPGRATPRWLFPSTFRLHLFIDFPASLRHLAQAGSRIVVPLGRKFVTGYIVAVLEALRAGTSLQESDIKDAKEILDVVPLVTPELLELTRWVAEYYLAPWGEVIKAALPPGISPTIEQFLSITENGRVELSKLSSPDDISTKQRLLQLVSESEEVNLAVISDQLGNVSAGKLARELEDEGLLQIKQRPGSEFVKAKYHRRVRLVAADLNSAADAEGRKFTTAQLGIIEALRAQDSLALPELLARADVSSSPQLALWRRERS